MCWVPGKGTARLRVSRVLPVPGAVSSQSSTACFPSRFAACQPGAGRNLHVWSRGLMERVQPEPLGLKCPSFTDELVGREPLQRLEPPGEVIGCHEIAEVLPELIVAVVVVASHGRVLI